MSDYQLHCFAQSGNSYKAALMLQLCEADWEPIWVDFFNGAARSPEFLAINEMGEVPVLIHGDTKLSQTGVILDYLSSGLGKFSATSAADRREIMRWILWDNHKFTANIATHRFMKLFLKTGDTPVTEFLSGRFRGAFKVLDNHLKGREWVVGDRPTIADISICGYLFYDGEIEVDWARYPEVTAWLGRIKALPGWVHPYELMPGHPMPEKSA